MLPKASILFYFATYSSTNKPLNNEDQPKIFDIDASAVVCVSENYVLQGLIHSMRITNPMRGMKYLVFARKHPLLPRRKIGVNCYSRF
jgi:hypothetical protein